MSEYAKNITIVVILVLLFFIGIATVFCSPYLVCDWVSQTEDNQKLTHYEITDDTTVYKSTPIKKYVGNELFVRLSFDLHTLSYPFGKHTLRVEAINMFNLHSDTITIDVDMIKPSEPKNLTIK